MSYLPEVAWSTIAGNVSLGATTYRYYITVNPLDPNEAGASTMSMAINDWFIDFAGYPFLIEEINGSILTVYDILERGNGTTSAYGPYANKLGYVYRPLNGAIILTQAQLRKLDASAADIIQPIEKGIQWAYRGIRLVSVDDDYSNITRLDLTNNLKYTYTENKGWQGGHKAELDLNIGLGTGALAEMEYTNNGDGTITIQSNTFMLYDNVLGIGYPKPYLVSGGTFSFTDNTYNYIVIDYNGGTPTMYVITDVTLINETTIVPVFSVLRRGTVLCLTNWDTLGNAKLDKLHQSIVKTQRYRRQSGLAISVPSTGTPRRASITKGIVWIGAVQVELNTTVSGDAGVYMFEYYKSSGVWTYTLASQINNTYYQGTTDRVELTSNRYAVAFIFRGVEHYNDHIYLVYGIGDYTLSQAQASGQPSDLPIAISSHAILIGRIIIQKGSDTITETASAFDKAFLIQPASEHSGLSNLGWSVSGHTGTTGSVPVFNSSGVAIEASLTNGYIPYKTMNGLGNSPLFTDGTKVGINTVTPVELLDVQDGTGTQTAGDLVVDGTNHIVYIGQLDSIAGNTQFIFRDRLGNQKLKFFNAAAGSFFLGNFNENYGLKLQATAVTNISSSQTTKALLEVENDRTNTFPVATFNGGNVGFGTETPSYTVDVNGTVRIGTLTGVIKGTSGVLSIATAGIDYENPLTFQHSLTRSTNTINLVGDSDAPGNSKYYGTNSSGTKGYYDLPSGGSGSPGGSNTYVQFNDSGSFGGDSGLTYNKTTDALTINGNLFAGLSNSIKTAKVYYNTSTKELSYYSDAFAALTDGATVTWDCTTGLNKTLTTSRSEITLTISNVSNGMKGDLIVFTTTSCRITAPFGYEDTAGGMVIQDIGNGSATFITFTSNIYTAIVGWRLKWSYDGTRYYYEGSYLRNESAA